MKIHENTTDVIRVDLSEQLPLCLNKRHDALWCEQVQEKIRASSLASFLPTASVDGAQCHVTYKMSNKGQAVGEDTPIPGREINKLRKAWEDTAKEWKSQGNNSLGADLAESLHVPSPNSYREAWRVCGTGPWKRLQILWGFQGRSKDDTVTIDKAVTELKSLGIPTKTTLWHWIAVAILLLIMVGLYLAWAAGLFDAKDGRDVMPVAVLSLSPFGPVAPDEVVSADISGTYVPDNDADVVVTDMSIDWGDGNGWVTVDDKALSHSYLEEGKYVVRLQVQSSNKQGAEAEQTIQVFSPTPPKVALELSPGTRFELGVELMATVNVHEVENDAEAVVELQEIDWGDGNGDEWQEIVDQISRHRYEKVGVYSVKCRVHLANGGQGYREKQVVVVPTVRPVALLQLDPVRHVEVGSRVHADLSGVSIRDNDIGINIVTSEIDWGDSSKIDVIQGDNLSDYAIHSYEKPSSDPNGHTVTLTVKASNGQQDLDFAPITVHSPIEPVAEFTIEKDFYQPGEVVEADLSSCGVPDNRCNVKLVLREINWGDGDGWEKVDGNTREHTYSSKPNDERYQIRVRARASNGRVDVSSPLEVTIQARQDMLDAASVVPVANLSLSRPKIQVEETTTARIQGSRVPENDFVVVLKSKEIDWGEGNGWVALEGDSADHLYNTAGRFQVRLKVIASNGREAHRNEFVEVVPPFGANKTGQAVGHDGDTSSHGTIDPNRDVTVINSDGMPTKYRHNPGEDSYTNNTTGEESDDIKIVPGDSVELPSDDPTKPPTVIPADSLFDDEFKFEGEFNREQQRIIIRPVPIADDQDLDNIKEWVWYLDGQRVEPGKPGYVAEIDQKVGRLTLDTSTEECKQWLRSKPDFQVVGITNPQTGDCLVGKMSVVPTYVERREEELEGFEIKAE